MQSASRRPGRERRERVRLIPCGPNIRADRRRKVGTGKGATRLAAACLVDDASIAYGTFDEAGKAAQVTKVTT